MFPINLDKLFFSLSEFLQTLNYLCSLNTANIGSDNSVTCKQACITLVCTICRTGVFIKNRDYS